MTGILRGRIHGSVPGQIDWTDAKRIGLNVLWVMLAAGATALIGYVAKIPQDSAGNVALVTSLTALLQFLQKFFSDTRNIPVVGSEPGPPAPIYPAYPAPRVKPDSTERL